MQDVPSFLALIALLTEKDYQVEADPPSQLHTYYADQALPYLLERLADPQPVTRAAALRGLGRLKDKRTIPAMQAALADEDAEVRKEAARFLAPMRDPGSVEPLIALLADPRIDVRLAAITPLGRHLFDPRSAQALLHFLLICEESLRPITLTALSKSDDAQIITQMIKYLHNRPLELGNYLINLVLQKDEYAPDEQRVALVRDVLMRTGAYKGLGTILDDTATSPFLKQEIARLLNKLALNL